MIFLYAILLVLALSSIRRCPGNWNDDYISKDTSDIIKGVCIWIVFICHISGYLRKIPDLPAYDALLFEANGYVRQLLVVPFLFFSGYGVTLAVRRKGKPYADGILRGRCLTTLLNFDVAVIAFLILDLLLGIDYDWFTILLSFTAWKSIGNSNWYIFCIILCYGFSWLSYRLFGYNRKMLVSLSVLVIAYTAAMHLSRQGSWWYDSVYAYAGGGIFAYYKERIEYWIKSRYWMLCIAAIFGFLAAYRFPGYYGVPDNICGLFLCMIIVLFTSKVSLKSRLLEWSGRNLFPLYIYQRIPMVALSTICGGTFMTLHPYLYIASCLLITLLLAIGYRYIQISAPHKSKPSPAFNTNVTKSSSANALEEGNQCQTPQRKEVELWG